MTRYAYKRGSCMIYEVQCDCGTVRLAHASSLRKGMKSCGCESKGGKRTTKGKEIELT